ncbi:hypothetical protein [Vitiosangium sp. GDMCC 1.1324]|uniref:hypothetical protein n=1 Tax=Vitiosangium sp. (strain GDMCC 1.1324) TaxID=2138576 RepID=UPI000D3D82C8|nr:hypothetical protein [Vitiosangium sp. GDMCC 1.1324]PTL81067.1 hypothetical protein DAT35_23320 [Vitiosangium sp. GDMCC 1.1324]
MGLSASEWAGRPANRSVGRLVLTVLTAFAALVPWLPATDAHAAVGPGNNVLQMIQGWIDGPHAPAPHAHGPDGPCNRTDNIWYICKTYYRGEQKIHLRYGIQIQGGGSGWGYEHIKEHGWSAIRDSWIEHTLQAGTPEFQKKNHRMRYTSNPGGEPGCVFYVYVLFETKPGEPAPRFIDTAFGNDFCSIQ